MLFAHLKRILRLDRLRLRGPNGARNEFLLAATAQNLRKLAKLIAFSRRWSSPHEAETLELCLADSRGSRTSWSTEHWVLQRNRR